MTVTPDFRDQPQIERIRERLWGERDFGRAAVMVGSGFSRNASAVSPGVPRFPLWRDTAERMLDDLHPTSGLDEESRGRRRAPYTTASGAMRLASEYEISFGRSTLDNLLLESIPDTSYEPGHLHEMLLSLPWADIFTTNYDTLLERARPRVFERKYGLVLDPSDVPAYEQPRIVKLHGSFPSQRPFILTEEDFRTYPTRFAPFVNLVQQSITENAFCLLGFSGEDPNFLSWTGWVRDNLGASAPRIYLCGLLDLSGPARRLLESRNVVPVDLSPLFPTALWPRGDERHEKAIEWLLLNLMNGKPSDPDDWLEPPSRRHRWRQSFDRPEVPEGPSLFTPQASTSPRGFDADHEKLAEIVETWRRQRLEYPGWVVCPEKVRSRLWPQTQFWIDPILRSLEEMAVPDNLETLYELNWRLEKALVPLFNVWSEKIVETLGLFNPFPDLINVQGATVTPQQDEHAGLGWQSIADWWVELSFAVVREAREDQDDDRFRLWMDRLAGVIDRETEWRSRWFYEECLFHLYRFDQDQLRRRLQEWARETAPPLWEAKRAALLSEVGELEEAERAAEAALNRVREQLHPYSQDHALMSQEGWIMLLLEIIDLNVRDEPKGRRELFQERYKALEPRRCNPNVEVERLGSRVSGPVPQEITGFSEETIRGFDPGEMSERVTFGAGFSAAPAFPAFGFLMMLEEGGIPLKCGGIRIYPEDVAGCARWIKTFAPLWSLSALLRSVDSAQKEELDDWFDRVRVATLSPALVERLFHTLANGWAQSVRHLAGHLHEMEESGARFSERQVKVLAEVLSRISIRLSVEHQAELFDLAVEMYGHPLFKDHHVMHDCVKAVFKRLLRQAMGQEEILPRVNRLLNLPIPDEGGFTVRLPEWWPEPFEYVSWQTPGKASRDLDRSELTVSILNLLSVARSGSQNARWRAVSRLVRLYEIQGLTDAEVATFGEAIWARTDDETGLPADLRYPLHTYLRLPNPAHIYVGQLYKQNALAQEFKPVAQGDILNSTHSYDATAHLFRGGSVVLIGRVEEELRSFVDWSRDESIEILDKMHRCWDQEKEPLQSWKSRGWAPRSEESVQGRFLDWVRLIAEIILPRIVDADAPTKRRAKALLDELGQLGICTSYAAPATLYIDAALYDGVVEQLQAGLDSTDETQVDETVRGLCHWIVLGYLDERLPQPPERLLDTLVLRTIGRNMPGLEAALASLSNILRRSPQALRTDHLEGLCVALKYLLRDTELPDPDNRGDLGSSASPIPVDVRPDYRLRSATLAARLSREFVRREQRLPDVLERWRIGSLEDPLPEIRRAWQMSTLE